MDVFEWVHYFRSTCSHSKYLVWRSTAVIPSAWPLLWFESITWQINGPLKISHVALKWKIFYVFVLSHVEVERHGSKKKKSVESGWSALCRSDESWGGVKNNKDLWESESNNDSLCDCLCGTVVRGKICAWQRETNKKIKMDLLGKVSKCVMFL